MSNAWEKIQKLKNYQKFQEHHALSLTLSQSLSQVKNLSKSEYKYFIFFNNKTKVLEIQEKDKQNTG